MIAPQIEYKDKMTINLGERTFELIYPEKRSQRGGHGDLAAEGARAVRGIGGQC